MHPKEAIKANRALSHQEADLHGTKNLLVDLVDVPLQVAMNSIVKNPSRLSLNQSIPICRQAVSTYSLLLMFPSQLLLLEGSFLTLMKNI